MRRTQLSLQNRVQDPVLSLVQDTSGGNCRSGVISHTNWTPPQPLLIPPSVATHLSTVLSTAENLTDPNHTYFTPTLPHKSRETKITMCFGASTDRYYYHEEIVPARPRHSSHHHGHHHHHHSSSRSSSSGHRHHSSGYYHNSSPRSSHSSHGHGGYYYSSSPRASGPVVIVPSGGG